MIIQQRLDESAYNVRYDEIHNAFIISVIPSSLLDATLSDEAIKSIILEIDTEAANKLKKAENDFVGYLKGARSWNS